MTLDDLLKKLWDDYADINQQAGEIHALLEARGDRVINDHIAFRTYNIPNIGIDALAKSFLSLGYEPKGEYDFVAKKLNARHYEHADETKPKVFISELRLEEFSEDLQSIVKGLAGQVSEAEIDRPDFPVSGLLWDKISLETYEQLKNESEYVAWVAVFGFRANHFTVFVNHLKSVKSLEELNAFLKQSGVTLNSSGGEIKGTPKDLLEQSSTMGTPIDVELSDKKEKMPGCYYEFARRYPMPDGKLFNGFITQSADKIFESTDNK